jgi:hypothetical protein
VRIYMLPLYLISLSKGMITILYSQKL